MDALYLYVSDFQPSAYGAPGLYRSSFEGLLKYSVYWVCASGEIRPSALGKQRKFGGRTSYKMLVPSQVFQRMILKRLGNSVRGTFA